MEDYGLWVWNLLRNSKSGDRETWHSAITDSTHCLYLSSETFRPSQRSPTPRSQALMRTENLQNGVAVGHISSPEKPFIATSQQVMRRKWGMWKRSWSKKGSKQQIGVVCECKFFRKFRHQKSHHWNLRWSLQIMAFYLLILISIRELQWCQSIMLLYRIFQFDIWIWCEGRLPRPPSLPPVGTRGSLEYWIQNWGNASVMSLFSVQFVFIFAEKSLQPLMSLANHALMCLCQTSIWIQIKKRMDLAQFSSSTNTRKHLDFIWLLPMMIGISQRENAVWCRNPSFHISLLFILFSPRDIPDPQGLCAWQRALCECLGLTGKVWRLCHCAIRILSQSLIKSIYYSFTDQNCQRRDQCYCGWQNLGYYRVQKGLFGSSILCRLLYRSVFQCMSVMTTCFFCLSQVTVMCIFIPYFISSPGEPWWCRCLPWRTESWSLWGNMCHGHRSAGSDCQEWGCVWLEMLSLIVVVTTYCLRHCCGSSRFNQNSSQ